MTAFGNAWSVGDRYAYTLQPHGHGGIIRTISQPCGSYTQGMYGLYASLRLLRNSLQIFGQVAQRAVHNGMPYNFNKVSTGFSIQAMYYLDNWNFGGYYALEGALHRRLHGRHYGAHQKQLCRVGRLGKLIGKCKMPYS